MDLDNKIDYGPIIRIVTIFGAVVVVALFVSFLGHSFKERNQTRKQINGFGNREAKIRRIMNLSPSFGENVA